MPGAGAIPAPPAPPFPSRGAQPARAPDPAGSYPADLRRRDALPIVRAITGNRGVRTGTRRMDHRMRPLPGLAALVLMGGLLCAGLAGCASSSDTDPNQIPDEPAEALYNQGMAALQARNISDATKFFEEVEKQHPYSAIAPQAQIMDAYAYYRGNRYDEAITAIDHFLDLHPGNKDAAYAYYLKALCYYEQIADVRRDQKMTQDALAA